MEASGRVTSGPPQTLLCRVGQGFAPLHRTLGFNLVLFASELASAMLNQPYALEASPVLRQQAFETVFFATLHAAVLLGPTIQENADVL